MFEKRVGPQMRRAFVVCLAWAGVTLKANASDAPFRGRVVFTQIPTTSRDHANNDPASSRDAARLPPGSRIVIFDASAQERGVTNLTPDFVSAGKPDVSFDGTHLLFIGKKSPAERFGVWEMATDGNALREVVRFSADCVDAIHLSSIYTLDADQPVYQIAFVARAPGDGVLSIYTCRMDGSAVRRITFAPGGASDPHQLSDGRLLFRMWMPAETNPMKSDESSVAALFTVNTDGTDLFPFTGSQGATPEIPKPNEVPVFDDPMWDGVDAVLLGSRSEPAGRSSVVDDRKKSGQLYCLNAYLSDENPRPQASRGSIRGVRIWRVPESMNGAPVDRSPETSSSAAAQAPRETGTLLGEFSVESDGSFFLQVPARTPFRLETLDESGRVLRTMHTWMWVMPGERRGCIGCHEDRELTPPNRHVLALRKLPQQAGGAALNSETASEESETPGGDAP